MNNSFADAHPELVCEWSEKNLPLTPDGITYGSNKIVWRKADCGHEWQTSVKSRYRCLQRPEKETHGGRYPGGGNYLYP